MKPAGLVVCAVAFAGSAYTQEPPPERPRPIDEVLVNGVRPGPALWRVSKDGHELWILAIIEPLEKSPQWSAQEIESHIAASQAVLSPPRAETRVGFFRSITLLPALVRARHRADARTLEQALPHELYIRWLALRVRYWQRADEHLRPAFAAFNLFQSAMDQEGFSFDTGVWERVADIARRRHVKITSIDIDIKIKNPQDYLKDLDAVPRSAEVACLDSTITALEKDLPRLHERAVAWTYGDVTKLDGDGDSPGPEVCLRSLLSVPRFRNVFDSVLRMLHEQWLAAVHGALERNASTFAVLPWNEIKDDDGVLAILQRDGYEVQAPRSPSTLTAPASPADSTGPPRRQW
jgi:hypothetical protein